MSNTLLTKGKLKELKEIARCRKENGLSPLKIGVRECLRCLKEFVSEDMKNQHLCSPCREESEILKIKKGR